ncbi:MAG TPA: ribosomal RNA small subunit methyltransferase A [Nitrospirae bacterium]|nr:ribosomal RNA small subunit methyltransferase A [bacterium BMS3Bbin05]HDO22799.1 ribosomal RNA small subunit methyltransferase A [Nitrospirota bacterium]HDO36393.1 ribosomal RNA small subunit methyltransferase A [Nitrospirota bacterium]HDZ88447.1 ribosomal RNA small subunit methyltransferase A [Nitrospirota bacterium]
MKRSRIGQNFLFDPLIASRIVEQSGINRDDTVVEIGPGHGMMTRLLAERSGDLIAIELDRKLFAGLRKEFGNSGNVTLLNMDVMKYDFGQLGPFKVVANIPYYITTPIMFKLIEGENNLRSMTLTIQKEVAERIVANPGNKQYGVLSLMVQFYGKAGILFTIPAGAFKPRPKVDSAVIKVERHSKPPVDVHDRKLFDKIIKKSFAGRRKMISNTLKTLYPDIKSIMDEINIAATRRPETLSMEEFANLANKISEQHG